MTRGFFHSLLARRIQGWIRIKWRSSYSGLQYIWKCENREVIMSKIAEERFSNRDASPVTEIFTLFNQNNIRITLELPTAVQINLNQHVGYTCAPVLHNDNAIFPIDSAEFSVTLSDVKSDGGSRNVIANVVWWDPIRMKAKPAITFTCAPVSAGQSIQCTPSDKGYTQMRWGTTVSNGEGKQKLENSLDQLKISYSPGNPSSETVDGPDITIG